jgi:hypothetical protein
VRGNGQETTVRNHILPIAIAAALAAPCTALAGEKKTIEVNSFSFGQTNAPNVGSSTGAGSGRIGPDRIQHKHIGGVKYEDVQTQPKAPTTTPAGTTGLTAKGALGGSTGPNLKRPDGGGPTIGRHQ